MAEKSKNVVALFEEAKTDNEWFERLKQVKSDDGFWRLLEEKGLKFDEEFKKKLSAGKTGNEKELLDDNELEQVAGGFNWYEFTQFLYDHKIQL